MLAVSYRTIFFLLNYTVPPCRNKNASSLKFTQASHVGDRTGQNINIRDLMVWKLNIKIMVTYQGYWYYWYIVKMYLPSFILKISVLNNIWEFFSRRDKQSQIYQWPNLDSYQVVNKDTYCLCLLTHHKVLFLSIYPHHIKLVLFFPVVVPHTFSSLSIFTFPATQQQMSSFVN